MHVYCVYGLTIHSSFSLPELKKGDGLPDVHIRHENITELSGMPQWTGCNFSANSDEAYIFWEEVGEFIIRQGQTIGISPAPEVSDSVLQLFSLGPVMAVLLHQRGKLVLHATGVVVDGQAIVFLGKSGQGKSTLTAMFCQRGYSALADDLVPVDLEGAIVSVYPGFPMLRLGRDAAKALDIPLSHMPHPKLQKQYYDVTRGFEVCARPLSRIYVLSESDQPCLENLNHSDAFTQLVNHSYVTRLIKGASAKHHFFQCTDLVQKVPIRCLGRPWPMTDMEPLISLVEHDVRHGT